MTTKQLWHYTCPHGFNRIGASGRIKPAALIQPDGLLDAATYAPANERVSR